MGLECLIVTTSSSLATERRLCVQHASLLPKVSDLDVLKSLKKRSSNAGDSGEDAG
jgi:hypothetical protein